MSSMEMSFDVIIIGGGTAGLIIGDRLSSDPNHRVLVIEGGEETPSCSSLLSSFFLLSSSPLF